MKIFCCKLLILVCCCLFCGCGALARNVSAFNPGKPANQWDGSGYKRSIGVGTGIDPQAKQIEERLGYKS